MKILLFIWQYNISNFICNLFTLIILINIIIFIITSFFINSINTSNLDNGAFMKIIIFNNKNYLRTLYGFIALLFLFVETYKNLEIFIFFGHLLIGNFFIKIVKLYLIIFIIFTIYIKNLINSTKIYNLQFFMYTFLIVEMLQLLWCVTTLTAIIFILDTLNILLYLLILNNNSLNKKLNNDTILFVGLATFFWVSFFSTAVFFIAVLYFFIIFFTANISLITLISICMVYELNIFSQLKISFTIFLFIIFFFIKCGIAPVFYWKTAFLKSMSLGVLSFYIIVYFSTVFLFFINFLLINFYIFNNLIKLISFISCTIALIIVSYTLTSVNDITTFLVFSSILNCLVILITVSTVFNTAILFI